MNVLVVVVLRFDGIEQPRRMQRAVKGEQRNEGRLFTSSDVSWRAILFGIASKLSKAMPRFFKRRLIVVSLIITVLPRFLKVGKVNYRALQRLQQYYNKPKSI